MKIRKGYKIREIAGENVIVAIGRKDVDMTKVIMLNDSSRWLWENLQDADFDAVKIADMLNGRYEVDMATAAADAQRWIESLDKAGLLLDE